MADRFTPLTPRIGARVDVPREEVLSAAFADECLAALERHGVLVFPEIALSDDEHVAFSENLGEIVYFGGRRPDGSRDGSESWNEWAMHPQSRIDYVNTFRRIGERIA